MIAFPVNSAWKKTVNLVRFTAFFGCAVCLYGAGQAVLVSNYADNTIYRYSLTGSDLGVFLTTPSRPYGMALDSLGNLFVALPFEQTIRECQ
jgi:sugar lactone lactonase YvrE